MSNYNDLNSRREIIELKKAKAGLVQNNNTVDTTLSEAERYTQGLNASQKRKNFWDYNFKYVIGAVIAVICVISIIMSLVIKPKFDYSVVAATSAVISSYTQNLVDGFENIGEDIDQNGQVSVDVITINIQTEQTAQSVQETMGALGQLMAELAMGDAGIFLVDDVGYQAVYNQAEMNIFTDLQSIYPDNQNVVGDRFYIKDSKFADTLNLRYLPDDLSIVLRSIENYSDDKKDEVKYQHQLDMIDKIISE
ncbi:MAG: hypothetical protein IKV58_02065 [Oscillospiraceae bacterium]|nr:hypothetical protein [Oscillospiraceae bacterium]